MGDGDLGVLCSVGGVVGVGETHLQAEEGESPKSVAGEREEGVRALYSGNYSHRILTRANRNKER